MKKIKVVFIICTLIICSISCSKGGSDEPSEANLSISVSPDPGTSIVPALSANYAFKLVINSTPPKNGVRIDITQIKDSDNSIQLTQTSQTSSSTIKSVDMQLNSLVPGILYRINVDVVSLTTSTNKANLTFKIARK